MAELKRPLRQAAQGDSWLHYLLNMHLTDYLCLFLHCTKKILQLAHRHLLMALGLPARPRGPVRAPWFDTRHLK